MTAEELKDICLCGETTKVQLKEAPIPQKELAREMIAFANSKGGVMLFGVADKTGDNEESANQFKVTVWRTIQKSGVTIQKDTLKDNDIVLKSGSTIQKSEITTQKDALKDNNTTQKSDSTTQKDALKDNNTTQKGEVTTQKSDFTTQKKVLEYFRNHPTGTRAEAAIAIGDITEDGVKFTIGKLQQKGLLKRVGGRKHGEWQVLLP